MKDKSNQTSKFIDAYKILELDNTSNLTNKQVKQAYIKLVKQYHPDTLNSTDEDYNTKLEEYNRLTQLVNDAYNLIKDVPLRTKYSVEYEKNHYLSQLSNLNAEYFNLKNKVKPDIVSNPTYHKHNISILDMYSDKYFKKIQLTLKDGFKSTFDIKSYKQVVSKPILKKFVYKTIVDSNIVFKEQSFIIDINIENYDDEYVSVMYNINNHDVHIILKDKNLFLNTKSLDERVDIICDTVLKYIKLDSKSLLLNKLNELTLLANNKQNIVKFRGLGLGKTIMSNHIQGDLYIQLDDNVLIDDEVIPLKLLNYDKSNISQEDTNNEYTINSLPIILLFILSAYLIENYVFV